MKRETRSRQVRDLLRIGVAEPFAVMSQVSFLPNPSSPPLVSLRVFCEQSLQERREICKRRLTLASAATGRSEGSPPAELSLAFVVRLRFARDHSSRQTNPRPG